jgi:hypothetical protein
LILECRVFQPQVLAAEELALKRASRIDELTRQQQADVRAMAMILNAAHSLHAMPVYMRARSLVVRCVYVCLRWLVS